MLSLKKALITQFTRINYHCIVNFRTIKDSNYSSLNGMTRLTHKANVAYCLEGSCDKTRYYIGKTFSREGSGASFWKIRKICHSCKDCHS